MESCSNCKFKVYESCRRYPPVLILRTEGMLRMQEVSSEWPKVRDMEWCGEFKPKLVPSMKRGGDPPTPG